MPQLIRVVDANGGRDDYTCDHINKSSRRPDGGIDVTLSTGEVFELRPGDGTRVFQMIPDGSGGFATTDRIRAYDTPEDWGPNGPPPKYAKQFAEAIKDKAPAAAAG